MASAELTPTGGARLRLTLLVAGFVVGPAGASVRDITRQTACDIRSHTDTYRTPGAPPSAKPRRVRTFILEVGLGWHGCCTRPELPAWGLPCRPPQAPANADDRSSPPAMQGKRRSVVAALQVITDAVDRYCDLCGGRFMHQAVEREQTVRGCAFFYSPPPRAAVPFAAALRNTAADSPPAAGRGRASASPPPSSPFQQQQQQTQYVLVPVRSSSALAPLTTAEAATELLAALTAAGPAGQEATQLAAQLYCSASLGSATSQAASDAAGGEAVGGLLRSMSLGPAASPMSLAATLQQATAAPTGMLVNLGAPSARRMLSLERNPAGCLDELLLAEAADAGVDAGFDMDAWPVSAATAPTFSLFSGGGGPQFGADPGSASSSLRLGSPMAVLATPAVPCHQPHHLYAAAAPATSDHDSLAACGFPAWRDFAAQSPDFHSPALARLFSEDLQQGSLAPPTTPAAPGGWGPF